MMHHARKCLLLILAGLLAGCAGGFDGARPVIAMDGTRIEVQDPVENGRALLLTGQYGLAIEALSAVLHDEPQNVRALNLIAEAYARLHRFDLADRYHAEALEIDPNSVAALNNWGFSELVRGDRTRATALLQRAAAIDAGQPVVAANLRLATGDVPAAAAQPGVANIAASGEVAISNHVVVLRRTGKLVRLAPGVQLLITSGAPAEATQPAVSSAAPRPITGLHVPLPYLPSAAPVASGADPRARVLAALQRLLDPSPFAFFPEVDDYNAMWRAGAWMAGEAPLAATPQG